MRKKIIIPCLAFIMSFSLVNAQNSPYQFQFKTEATVLGTGTLLTVTGLLFKQNFQPLTLNEIDLLDAGKVFSPDRSAIDHYSTNAAKISDVLLISSLGMNALLPLAGMKKIQGNKKLNHFFQIALMSAEANLLTYGGTELTKILVSRTRPYVYNTQVPVSEKLNTDARKSFFSGHTSFAAANAFLVASVVTDYYPDSKLKPWIWAAAAVYPAWTGLERYLGGKHFPTDILAGYAYGAFCGWLTPFLHRNNILENSKVLVMPVSNGVYLSYSF